MYKKFLLALVLIFSFAIFNSANAFTLTPIRLEISGDPGQIIQQKMTVINEEKTSQTYYSSYMNFEAQGETGSPTFVAAKDDLGTWMEVPKSVTLGPGESKSVPLTIRIPDKADPGGHFAAVFWGTSPVGNNADSVSIGARTGMLVLLHVSGAVDERGGIIEYGTTNKQTYFTALPVTMYYRFQNNGGDRIKPAGEIAFKDIIGLTAKKIDANQVEGNILPNSIRKFETTWEGKSGTKGVEAYMQGGFFDKVSYEWSNFAFGRYNAKLNLTYGTSNTQTEASFVFWVFPWHLLLTIFIIILIILIIAWLIMRHYNHWVILKAEELLKKEEQNEAAHTKSAPHKRV